MNWNQSRIDSRKRYVAKYSASEAEDYEQSVGHLSRDDQDAYLADIRRVTTFAPGMRVLDVGAGTGTMCRLLSRLPGLTFTALEPSAGMSGVLKQAEELNVKIVNGLCDGLSDRQHFPAESFDVIVSRQVFNGLHDPIVAFENWHHWLADGGTVVIIDGFYGRDGWTGHWQEEVDVLPASACQTMALAPYLLEYSGFTIGAVEMMADTNNRPITRTPRYIVVATK